MKKVRVSSAIVITDLGAPRRSETRFVVTNEATGRHFSADQTTVTFLEGLRRTGNPEHCAASARITSDQAGRLLETFARNGLVASDGLDVELSESKQPLEGKVIALRFDILNARDVARRLSWLGRALFSAPMFLVWIALLFFALATFLENIAHVYASVSQISQSGLGNWLAIGALFVAIKIIHELGHILAYRVMCLREGFDPGPIRVGLMVFAATPFPYTDVTGAWRLASRWRRVTIGAAGMYFESFVVALLVLAWATLDLGALEPVILQTAVFSGALTLMFNLNPAVKLDGYYILTDLANQPNLAGRASQAARTWVWRALGADAPRPGWLELGYWAVSYLYRWTIFASVFWLAYRFDQRLATVILLVATTLLVLRPLSGTIRPVLRKVSPVRAALTVTGLVTLAVLAFVPFKARLLTDGQIFLYRTEFLRPAEPAQLIVEVDGTDTLTFLQPELEQDRTALQTRLEIVSNMTRSGDLDAVETAALESDRRSLVQRLDELNARIARLSPQVPEGAKLTHLTSEILKNQWLTTGGETAVAAVSVPVDQYLEMTLHQNRLETAMSETMRVRFVGAPECMFDAKTVRPWSEAIVRDGRVTVEASPLGPLPDCARIIRNGEAIVARVPLPPRSIAERLQKQIRRLLQERLPFEQET